MRHFCAVLNYFLLAACTTLVTSASSQTSLPEQSEHPAPTAGAIAPSPQADHPGTITGSVVSVSRETMVVRTEDNHHYLFVFDSDLVRPKGLTSGAHIRVESNSTTEPGVLLATRITVLEPAASATTTGPPPDVAPPPKEVREVQREIEKLARRWQIGVRIGGGLDPELFLLGVHTAIGPIFNRDFYLRPNVEFAFGELTDMAAINLEGAYRLPVTFRQGRWSAYVGAGPGLNFIHQGVGKRDISFSNFDYQTGLNVFSGVRFRRGTFAEVKTSLWAEGVPTLRMMFGYTF
jgi:hypothetical protein